MRFEDGRRLKVAYVDYGALTWYFQHADRLRKAKADESLYIVVPEFDLPDDVQIIGVYNDMERQGLAIVLHSVNFEEVPRGEMLPHIGKVDIRHQSMRIQIAKDA